MNIWIISPGEKAKYFKECYNNNMIVIGWDSIGDIRQYASIDELKQALQEKDPTYKNKNPSQTAKMLWDFGYEIEEGDLVVARDGLTKLIGIGILGEYIPASYKTNPSNIDGHHQVRKVHWINDNIKEIPFKLSRNTIINLDKLNYKKQKTIKELVQITESDNEALCNYIKEVAYNYYYNDYYQMGSKLSDILYHYPLSQEYKEVIKKYIKLVILTIRIYQYLDDMRIAFLDPIIDDLLEDRGAYYPNLWESLLEFAEVEEDEEITEELINELVSLVYMGIFEELFAIGKADYIDEQLEFLYNICEKEGC